jgi:hypothetical protein
MEFIVRFLEQVTLIDMQFKGTPELLRKAVWSCYQENPVDFGGYVLHDPGAFHEPPLSGKMTDRIAEPWKIPSDEKEADAVNKMQDLMRRLKNNKK